MAAISRFQVQSRTAAAASRKPLILLSVLALAVFAILVTSCGSSDEGGGATTPGGDTTGITDTSIKIGALVPTSGIAAIYGGAFAAGMQAYFAWLNDQGGIYGRKVDLIIQDSQFSGPVATEAARYLIDSQHVFAFIGNLGDPVDSAVKQMLDEQNIPDMFLLAGAKEFVDPVQKNRFVSQVTYETEGKIFGTYLAKQYAGKKVGIIAQNDASGKEGEAGIKEEIENEKADVTTTTEYYDPTVTDVTAQCQRLKGANVDAVMFYGSAMAAASMIKTIRETLSWDVPMLMNEGAGAQMIAPLAGAANMDGMVSTTIADLPSNEKTPFYTEWQPVFEKYATNAPAGAWDAMGPTGILAGDLFAGILKLAGPDLTRESFEAAAEHVCKYQVDPSQPPSSTSPTDHSFAEAMIMTKASLDSSVKEGVVFYTFGGMISFESTPDCSPAKMPAGAKDQPGPDLGVY